MRVFAYAMDGGCLMDKFDVGDKVFWINFKCGEWRDRTYVAIEEVQIRDIDTDSDECFLFEDYYNNDFWATRDEVFKTRGEAVSAACKFLEETLS